MYAIIQTGGKQFRVEKGMKLHIQKLLGDAGSEIQFPEVLVVSGENGAEAKIGAPYLPDSKVSATILRQFRDEKVIIFKKRSKKGYKKKQGHRQYLTEVEIKEIQA